MANLGDREDSFYDWNGDSTINTGPGNDNPVYGYGGNDHLNGTSAATTSSGTGNDVLDGGPGNDYLEDIAYGTEADTAGSDTYIGGGDSDRLNLDGRSEDLALSLDGVANDGAAGEGDNIGPDISTVVGGTVPTPSPATPAPTPSTAARATTASTERAATTTS